MRSYSPIRFSLCFDYSKCRIVILALPWKENEKEAFVIVIKQRSDFIYIQLLTQFSCLVILIYMYSANNLMLT